MAFCSSILPFTSLYSKFSFDTIYDFVRPARHEASVEQEYELQKPGILTVNNTQGNITITTEWKRNSICMKATKRASSDETLEALTIKTSYQEQNDSNHLIISSKHDSAMKGIIDYQFIVPAHVQLNLHSDYGTITVHDVQGPVIAKTKTGNIEITNIANAISAQTEENGSILIEKARDNIKAATNKGNITIHDATKSIIATTQKGNISTACNNVPSQSKIKLCSLVSGAITLAVPPSANATLQGKTVHGKLTSDLDVTIKPFTTKLNKKTRREFERQVDGVLGTGEADIQITCNNGNICITETRAS